MSFLDLIKNKARENKKNIVLPESHEPRILQAAEIILKENIYKYIIIQKWKIQSQNLKVQH